MKNNYHVDIEKLPTDQAFTEASKEELRVLLTLISLGTRPADEADISRMAGVSAARCRAAIAFWEGAGFVSSSAHSGIVEEFEDRLTKGEIDEVPSVVVAENIRDENLSDMISEVATLMGQACLPNGDVKNLTALISQYRLTAEFVVVLAAHLASKDELTVRRLCNKAISLSERGCDDLDRLEKYISSLENGEEWEYRRVMGLYGGALSKSQSEYIKRWSQDFGYSPAIVAEAYDIAVMNTKGARGDMRYMDSVLTAWHEAGARTLNDCRAQREINKQKYSEKTAKKNTKSQPETPRYGNFDVDEAFLSAIERSFGDDGD